MFLNLSRQRIVLFVVLVAMPLYLFAGGKKESPEKSDMPAETKTEQSASVPENDRVELESVADIAARVNGVSIPMAKFNSQVEAALSQYTNQGVTLKDDQMAKLREQVLDNLIGQELLYQDAVKNGVKVSDADVDAQLEKIVNQFNSKEDYEKALEDQGITEGLLKDDLRMNLALNKYIDTKFKPQVVITEEEEAAFYGQNPQYFSQPEQVRASHILIKVDPDADEAAKAAALKKIKDVQKRLANGEEFSDLAREVSEGPSNVNGGDLGYFGRGQMVKPFEDAAFGLKKGEISGIVETKFGYHIIKLTDKKAAGLVPFDKVKDQIKDHLFQVKLGNMLKDYINSLEPDADIEKLVS